MSDLLGLDDRKPSRRLTFDDAVQVWIALWRGEFKNRIAARFDVNVFRIYEIRSGKLHLGSEVAARAIWQKSQHDPAA